MTSPIADRMIRAAGGGIGAHGTHSKIEFDATQKKTGTALLSGVTYDLIATQDCWVCGTGTGAADAAADDFYLVANVYIPYTPPDSMLHLSATRVATDGVLYINRREDAGLKL